MKALLILAVGCCLLSSCHTTHSLHERAELRDSTYTEQTNRVEKEYLNTSVVVKDTLVDTPLPPQQSMTVGCDSSVLETDFATSSAWIDNTGKLHHTINNKESALINVPGGKTEIAKEQTSEKAAETIVTESVKETIDDAKEEQIMNERFLEWLFYPFGVICFCLLTTWGILKLLSKQLFK